MWLCHFGLLLASLACVASFSIRDGPHGKGLCRLPRQQRHSVSMRVVPLSKTQMQSIVPRKVTRNQLMSYWGMNSKERLQRVLESLLVSYGGAWMAWFVSFMVGSLASAVLGTALIFNWMYTPWLNAKRRNALVYPSTSRLSPQGLRSGQVYYAAFLGRIASLKKVRRRAGKTIGAVSQEFLVMKITDERQRELEIITQWQVPYSQLRVNMRCPAVIAATDSDFTDVFVVTDVYVPACDMLVGDYPYLQKTPFVNLLRQIDQQQSQVQDFDIDFDVENANEYKNENLNVPWDERWLDEAGAEAGAGAGAGAGAREDAGSLEPVTVPRRPRSCAPYSTSDTPRYSNPKIVGKRER